MVSHARSAAQRREQRRRAEARFAGRLCKLVEQCHRGFVLARALVRGAAGCLQDASTQTQLEDLVGVPVIGVSPLVEEVVQPAPMTGTVLAPAPVVTNAALVPLTLEGGDLAAVVSAHKQQCALTAEICKSAAHGAVKAHMDQHNAVLSRVDALEAVVSALKQQSALTAEICRSAAHEAVHALVQPVLSRVKSLERLVGPPSPERLNLASAVPELRQQSALIAEICKSAAFEDLSKAELSRVERVVWSSLPFLPCLLT